MEQNDHDILIELQAMMKIMVANQADFLRRHEELSARVAVLEKQDSRDSERFKGIADEIRRSLNNSTRIDTLAMDLNSVGEKVRGVEGDVQELRSRSNRGDVLTALAAAIAAAIGWFR